MMDGSQTGNKTQVGEGDKQKKLAFSVLNRLIFQNTKWQYSSIFSNMLRFKNQ